MATKNLEKMTISFTCEFLSDTDIDVLEAMMKRARAKAGNAAANGQYDRYDNALANVGSVMMARTERRERAG